MCANAGIDLSNVEAGQAALLPVDPDRSAKHIRDALRARAGVDVAVIVSDTFGRPWRRGLTDVAIGVSGIAAVVDLRETPDALGRILHVTEVAIADEIAAAAELVMGKAAGVPVAIVRGLDPDVVRRRARTASSSARPTRTCSDDRHVRARVPRGAPLDPRVPARAGARARRSTRSSRPRASRPRRTTRDRGASSSSTPTTPRTRSRPAWARAGAPTSKATASRRDASTSWSRRRTPRSCSAPALVLGCLTWDGLDRYPDERRRRAEWGMALLSLGAAVENLMLAAADRGLASCWVAAPIFCPEEARDALALPTEWLPHALVLVGTPTPPTSARVRPPVPLDDLRAFRS